MGYYCGGRQCCWDCWTRLILRNNLFDITYGKGDGSLIDIWFGNWPFHDIFGMRFDIGRRILDSFRSACYDENRHIKMVRLVVLQ